MLVEFAECWNVNNYLAGNIMKVDVEVGLAGLSLELWVV